MIVIAPSTTATNVVKIKSVRRLNRQPIGGENAQTSKTIKAAMPTHSNCLLYCGKGVATAVRTIETDKKIKANFANP